MDHLVGKRTETGTGSSLVNQSHPSPHPPEYLNFRKDPLLAEDTLEVLGKASPIFQIWVRLRQMQKRQGLRNQAVKLFWLPLYVSRIHFIS